MGFIDNALKEQLEGEFGERLEAATRATESLERRMESVEDEIRERNEILRDIHTTLERIEGNQS